MDCSVEQCDRPAKVRGLCRGHYQRFQRTGEMPTTPLAPHDRGRLCEVAECGRKHEAKGLCHSHYAELNRSGVRPTEPIVHRTAAERFHGYSSPSGDGCVIWIGTTDGGGRYGGFWDGTRLVRAHRWAYEQARGPIAEGLVLDHLCRVTLCVNPDHLEAVTQRENIMRGEAPTATNAAKTHCERGHPLLGDNLVDRPDGNRQCRECTRVSAREATRRWRERNREV